MNSKKTNAKEIILDAVLKLIDEVEHIEEITSRRITEKAGVNLAMINYYYQSKENLINQAVSHKMESITSQISVMSSDDSAYEQLIRLLISTADLSFKYNKFFKLAVEAEMRNGYMNSMDLIMPFLKEIYNSYNPIELKVVAMQLMIPFHQIVMYPDLYGKYLDTDFFEKIKRDETIVKMIESVLGK
ncbi:TetR/AcrR family transcriptional regulator [Oceanirhabdus sp. W0125-5]|uniref:TetR/AcrR family transcriptional regulator n=1 Tax=Oceanirhabdus sp. W0125-5 TaxID=2999116 RepID=UPI0022F325E7|nr:TetR/AcrR family transcriptional regulator [Oceanirhabdus sp. W0125-5]WBW95125.1 TetR/AcrR family transcriptional regulator [Oceanirhabdus sp. W0125-5]